MPILINGARGNQELYDQAGQDLGAGPLAHIYLVPAGLTVSINNVTLAFDGNVTQTVTITMIYGPASAFNTTLGQYDMVIEDELVWFPVGTVRITGTGTSGITVACTNAGAPAVNVSSTINMEVLK